MSWEIALQTLQERSQGTSQGEYGVFQRKTLPGTPFWRRHTQGKRFTSVEDALFNRQAAINALNETAPYAGVQYAKGAELHVAYVAAWLSETPFAFLARQATPQAEVTIVPVLALEAIDANDAHALTNYLAEIFGNGASTFGVRFLSAQRKILET
ncbi:hypothetical protein [Janthinobacterium lividum]